VSVRDELGEAAADGRRLLQAVAGEPAARYMLASPGARPAMALWSKRFMS